jgi:hypothetical protein
LSYRSGLWSVVLKESSPRTRLSLGRSSLAKVCQSSMVSPAVFRGQSLLVGTHNFIVAVSKFLAHEFIHPLSGQVLVIGLDSGNDERHGVDCRWRCD